jgi:hypothetical protein
VHVLEESIWKTFLTKNLYPDKRALKIPL